MAGRSDTATALQTASNSEKKTRASRALGGQRRGIEAANPWFWLVINTDRFLGRARDGSRMVPNFIHLNLLRTVRQDARRCLPRQIPHVGIQSCRKEFRESSPRSHRAGSGSPGLVRQGNTRLALSASASCAHRLRRYDGQLATARGQHAQMFCLMPKSVGDTWKAGSAPRDNRCPADAHVPTCQRRVRCS